MRIRSKLVALIAVPLLAIGMIAFAGFRSQSVTIEQVEDAAFAIEVNTAMDWLVLAIGDERLGMVGADTGMTTEELQATTDQAFERLEAIQSTPQLEAATVDARNLVAATRAGTIAISVGMSDANRALLGAAVGSSDDFPTGSSYAGAFLNHNAILAIEAREAAWASYLDGSGTSADTVRNTSLQFGRAASLQATVEELVLATDTDTFDVALRSSAIRRLAELEAVALDDLGEGTRQIDETQVLDALVDFRTEWESSISNQGELVNELVTDEVDAANGSRSLFTLLAILGAAVMAALIFVIYRSVTEPLETLTERAGRVANEELPELMDQLRYGGDVDELPEATPIPVTSTDEIGELVSAFNDVQLTAYTLASEQAIGRRNVADMFVNLGRRNQQLLHRILNQLTRLEQKEEDPDTLRELFELDSAVTRMRRNAESLVALAGGHTARQWSKPVAIDNAVRGAFGEVEGYERIQITSLTDAEVQGNVVADLTHLMAELLENAINFSEPDTNVSVSGDYDGADYQVTILDEGIGMSPAELAENNSRITDPPPLERVPTKFLGLYVVGRLAERHGFGVRLSEAPKRGVMARIDIPSELLGGTRVEPQAPAADPTSRRASTDTETSPLEQEHDVDAELAAMLPDGDDGPVETGDDGLPVRSRSGRGGRNESTDGGATDEGSPDDGGAADGDDEVEAEPVSAAASAPAGAEPEGDGGLPTRGRKATAVKDGPKPTATKAAPKADADTATAGSDGETDAESDSDLAEPAEEAVEAEAAPEADSDTGTDTGGADSEGRLPVRRARNGDGPPPGADGLPTRGRRKDDKQSRSGKPRKSAAPKERTSLDQRAETDNSEKSAGDFSSMMSALSSGINRGLADTDSPDNKRSNSESSEEGSEG